MLRDIHFGRALAYRIRVEAEGFQPWDDLVEEVTSPSGVDRLVCWQVKRQVSDLKEDEFAELLIALKNGPGGRHGALGLNAAVSLKKVGPLAALADVIARAQDGASHASALVATKPARRCGRT